MVKRPAFLLGAAIDAVEPDAPVLVVWHAENVKQASATMSKPRVSIFGFIVCWLLLQKAGGPYEPPAANVLSLTALRGPSSSPGSSASRHRG